MRSSSIALWRRSGTLGIQKTLLILCIILVVNTHVSNAWGIRKLAGSNCIEIETGVVPRYFSCLGCVVEQAQGCIDDMRYNRSGNVDRACPLFATNEEHQQACCPVVAEQFRFNKKGEAISTGIDLFYVGSAYPEALRCIAKAGCSKSVIYSQLEDECDAVCGSMEPDVRNGGSLCYSDFNAARRTATMAGMCSLFMVAATIWMLLAI